MSTIRSQSLATSFLSKNFKLNTYTSVILPAVSMGVKLDLSP
jgi:hypothetical protein